MGAGVSLARNSRRGAAGRYSGFIGEISKDDASKARTLSHSYAVLLEVDGKEVTGYFL
jgi:hypothetical protein